MRKGAIIPVLLLVAVMIAQAQRPPEFGTTPEVGHNRIEVRFALGDQALVCRTFRLVAKHEGRILLSGTFSGGFEIPAAAKTLQDKIALDLEFRCGRHRWHFTQVGERAFLQGYWWVGTDYPPFQTAFAGDPKFKNAAWVRYLITDPMDDSGFIVYRSCPYDLRNVKSGPCFTD